MMSRLEHQYGELASSDVLLQNFYQMMQEKNEKIQAFTAKLDGSLNLLKL